MILGVIGFLLMISSVANGNESIWLMITQFLIGLALFIQPYINFVRKELENYGYVQPTKNS